MKTIREIGTPTGSYYEVFIEDNKVKTVKILRVKKEIGNKIYLFLFDTNGKVIDEVYKFLNIECLNDTSNSKEQMLSILRVLYSFKEIVGKDFKNFNKRDFDALSNFILGIGVERDEESKHYISGRSSNTHNIYFVVIRRFFRYLHIDNKALFEQKVAYSQKTGFGFFAHTKEVKVNKYVTNKKSRRRSDRLVPKYITVEEYKAIVQYLEKMNLDYTIYLRNRIIVDLMYTAGMRIGEVLGLTVEDVIVCDENGKYATLYIRNRTTDKRYQRAKTCMKVVNINDYGTKDYQTKGIGYQTINIGTQLYSMIREYINESRNIIQTSEKVMDNILTYAKADSVENNGNNQYIFLNKNGKPLAASGWGKMLKKIFIDIGITIDYDHKKNNLSHRFRHGYAMYLINVAGKSIEYVAEMMRHSSIQSTMIYYNPTEEEKIRSTISIEESIKEIIKN